MIIIISGKSHVLKLWPNQGYIEHLFDAIHTVPETSEPNVLLVALEIWFM